MVDHWSIVWGWREDDTGEANWVAPALWADTPYWKHKESAHRRREREGRRKSEKRKQTVVPLKKTQRFLNKGHNEVLNKSKMMISKGQLLQKCCTLYATTCASFAMGVPNTECSILHLYPAWTRSSTTYCRWPCFSRRVGLDDPQRSLQTPTILWFCDSVIPADDHKQNRNQTSEYIDRFIAHILAKGEGKCYRSIAVLKNTIQLWHGFIRYAILNPCELLPRKNVHQLRSCQ